MDAYALSRVKAANGAAADKRLKRRSGVFVCDFEKAHVRKQSRPVPELPSSSFGCLILKNENEKEKPPFPTARGSPLITKEAKRKKKKTKNCED